VGGVRSSNPYFFILKLEFIGIIYKKAIRLMLDQKGEIQKWVESTGGVTKEGGRGHQLCHQFFHP
jgi:hypothetical protein